MAFITMMVARMAYGKNITETFIPISLDSIDSTITLWMVVYGFLLIAVIQLLGTFGGSNPLQEFKNSLSFNKMAKNEVPLYFRIH